MLKSSGMTYIMGLFGAVVLGVSERAPPETVCLLALEGAPSFAPFDLESKGVSSFDSPFSSGDRDPSVLGVE